MPRKYSTSLKYIISTFCGWLYLWIVLVDLTTHLFLKNYILWEDFGTMEIKTKNNIIKLLFDTTIAIPQLLTIPPTLAINMFYASIKNNFNIDYFLEALPLSAFSIPLLLLSIIGFHYWHKKSRCFAWSISIIFIMAIFYIGTFLL